MIRVLDANTIDKIAAGEVIERPSSVVKELVENSIDSGATAITIEIKDGGMSFIRITDNGCGIANEEVPKAFLRHATSKLVTAEDLLKISSLGFRGEALSSISSVAQVEMVTKRKEDVTGTKYEIHGGTEISNSQIGVPDGTTIVVRNLFYNTPARKKYMKSPQTEAAYIIDLASRISMSHPEISFKVISNNQSKLFTSGNGKLKDIIYHIYGKDITNNLLPIDVKNEYIHITGYIARPCISRGNRTYEDYFVNQRYVKSRVITRAIEEAFKTFVMIHKFPFTVLNFDINPELIDVNVHPTKMDLKFENESEIYKFTYDSIRQALLYKELIPDQAPGKVEKPENTYKRNIGAKPEPFEQNRRTSEPISNNTNNPIKEHLPFDKKPQFPSVNTNSVKPQVPSVNTNSVKPSVSEIKKPIFPVNKETAVNRKEVLSELPTVKESQPVYLKPGETVENAELNIMHKFVQQTLFEEKFLTEEARIKHRIIGQLFKTYWLIEYDNKLFIMDQHAAHEKVKFEELMANYKNKKICTQQLLPAQIVSLTASEISFVKDNIELFEALGYQLEAFGDKEYKITGVPSNLFGLDGRELFLEYVGELSADRDKKTIDVFISKLSTMACKAAIKGNTAISYEEADALIEQLLKLENPYTCPHGRPTIISMTADEIDKKFKRIV